MSTLPVIELAECPRCHVMTDADAAYQCRECRQMDLCVTCMPKHECPTVDWDDYGD